MNSFAPVPALRFAFKYIPLGVNVTVDDADAAGKLLMSLDFQPRS